ncbi:MAG: (2Fe-2S)-binding protein, partial [Calditrichaeota bacterium]
MSEKEKPKGISRRKFLKNIGSGVVGSTVVIHGLKAGLPEKVPQDSSAPHEDKVPLTLTVNGKKKKVLIEPQTSLADLLRNELHLTGTKTVCNHGECGACTVLLDGKAVYSCHMLALDAAGREVTTIEGLLDGEELHPIQKA